MALDSFEEERQQLSSLKDDDVYRPYHPDRSDNEERVAAAGIMLNTGLIFFTMGVFTPFYPLECQQHNVPMGEIGAIFAMFYAGWVISGPLWSIYIWLVVYGVILQAGCFSWLAWSTFSNYSSLDAESFRNHGLVVRAIQGIAVSSSNTGGHYIILSYFPKSTSIYKGLDMCAILGYIIGAMVAGYVYDYDSSKTVFVVVVVVIILSLLLLVLCLPKLSTEDGSSHLSMTSNIGNKGFWQFLRTGRVILFCGIGIFFVACITFLEPMLGLQVLKRFSSTSPSMVALLFLVFGLSYMVISPLVGLAGDYFDRLVIVVFGFVFVAIGLYAFISFVLVSGSCCLDSVLWQMSQLTKYVFGLMLIGIGVAMGLASMYHELIDLAGPGNRHLVFTLLSFLSIGEITGSLGGSFGVQAGSFVTVVGSFAIISIILMMISLTVKGFNLCTAINVKALRESNKNYRI